MRMANDGWKAKMRHAEIAVLQNCGHYPHQEAPLFSASLAGEFITAGSR
jgi:pimeloyl-ACP methyl ester carboxylesterase